MTEHFVRPPDRIELARMEEARRATQRQLDLIERDIARRIATFVSRRGQFVAGEARIRPSDHATFRRRYRETLAALTAERQTEIDALARKLGRQDCAIDAFAKRHGLARANPEATRPPSNDAANPCRSRTGSKAPCRGSSNASPPCWRS